MTNKEYLESLYPWQRAIVGTEALRRCRDYVEYQAMDVLACGDWPNGIGLWADARLFQLREASMDEVLEDTDFMEAITTEAEDRFMTRGNANA